MDKNYIKTLKNISNRLRSIALDVRQLPDVPDHQDPAHDADRIDKEANKIDKLVTGRGTGDD